MAHSKRIDPESRGPLEAFLEALPGGFNAIPDVGKRREVVAQMVAHKLSVRPISEAVSFEDIQIPGSADAPELMVRVYRPTSSEGTLAGIVYIHGGGMLLGTLDSEHDVAAQLCEQVGAVVVSVDYRLAPEHPYPAGLNDCYAGLEWTFAQAAELGVDPERIAVAGISAGGGLAIAVALLARDRGGPKIAFLAPAYPMIDDRCETPSSQEFLDVGVWDRESNIEAWAYYLAGKPADVYAAPARAQQLAGLPPVHLDVGELDLFRDETVEFALRLLRAGVPTELHVYPGAYHSSETFAPDAPLSKEIWAQRIRALRKALYPS